MRLRAALVILVVCILGYPARNFVLDDALIYARYVSNALAGNGLVFNVGERVNALTSPLFSYLILGASALLHGNVLLADSLLSGVALIAACLLAEWVVPYSGILVASTEYFYWFVGMETSLFLCMLILAVLLYTRERYNWLPLVLSLLILTRFEGGALVLVVAWHLYRRHKIPKWYTLVPPFGILLLYLGINHFWYGTYLPASTSAKFLQGMSGYWGRWPFAFLHVKPILLQFKWTPYFLPLVFIFAMLGIRKMRGTSWNQVLMPFLAILACFYLLFNIPPYFWYYAPFLFFGILYAVSALPRTKTAYGALLAMAAIQCLTNVAQIPSHPANESYRAAGQWLAVNSAPTATVAACEIGTLGWYSHRYLYDIVGLTTPKNAEHVAHRDEVSWFAEDHPDYVVIHMPAWGWEKPAVASPAYELVPVRFGNLAILRKKTPDQSSSKNQSEGTSALLSRREAADNLQLAKTKPGILGDRRIAETRNGKPWSDFSE
jgi:arabinofuranosyltransferase